MAKKLTPKQKEEKEFNNKVKKAMTDVKSLSKKHGLIVLKRASFLYWRSLSEKANALEKIKESEEEINRIKKQYRI